MRQVEAAGEQARLFNARELLFERELTDYQQLSNIKKKFEPYFQLWDTSERWLSASREWHSSSFVTLEAEQIETDVNTCVEIKIVRRVRAESSRRPPRHRRDACSMAYAPDALVDFHTD